MATTVASIIATMDVHDRASGKLKTVTGNLLKLGAVVSGIGAIALKKFGDFDSAMRNVNVIAKESENQFRRSSDAVLEMSQRFAKPATDTARALYDINSASFTGAQGLKVLEAASKAGRAGVSDTATAARAITAILNAYGKEASEAADVSDILFKTVEKGVITFDELAQHSGTAVASAALAGVEFGEVAAAVATMTRGGIRGAEAFTALNRFLLKLVEGGEELDKVFQAAGYDSAKMAAETAGLGTVLNVILKATNGDAKAIMDLGFQLRAFKAVASIARGEGREFAKDLIWGTQVAERAGATENALVEQTKSLGFQFEQLKTTIGTTMIRIGRGLAPVAHDLLPSMIEKVDALGKAFENLDQPTLIFIGRLTAMTAALTVLGGTMKVLKVPTIVTASWKGVAWAVGGVVTAVKTLGIAVVALKAALVALVAAVGWFAGKWWGEFAGLSDYFAKWFFGADKLREQLNEIDRQRDSFGEKMHQKRMERLNDWVQGASMAETGSFIAAMKPELPLPEIEALTKEQQAQQDKFWRIEAEVFRLREEAEFKQLDTQGKINFLIEKRLDLEKKLKGITDPVEAIKVERDRARLASRLVDLQKMQSAETRREFARGPQFAAAAEKGTVAAYSMVLKAGTTDRNIEKHTKATADNTEDIKDEIRSQGRLNVVSFP